jgi:hypothetical protein
MRAILLGLFRFSWLFARGNATVTLENLALRQQLAIYKRKNKRPRLIRSDRWFWIALATIWKDWRRALLVVHPDTVVRWQRQRFRSYWAELSNKCGKSGRPPMIGMTSFSSKWILSHSTWYKNPRSRQH